MENPDIEKSPLRALFWKDELLQVLYWMDGEGFGDAASARQILPFLNTNLENLLYHLQKSVEEGYLEMETAKLSADTMVRLSPTGKKEAGRRFSEAFEGLQKAGHGECGPDCEFCYGPDGQKLENCVHNCGH